MKLYHMHPSQTVRWATIPAQGGHALWSLPMVAPPGIVSRPAVGQKVLLTEVQGETCCLGRQYLPVGLAPGELMLSSAGGGKVHLKADGSVSINGVVIDKNGEIQRPMS